MRELDKKRALEKRPTVTGFGQCTCPGPCVSTNCGGCKPPPPQKCVSEVNSTSVELKKLYK